MQQAKPILINDTTPPPVPTILGQTDLKDAVIVTWLRGGRP